MKPKGSISFLAEPAEGMRRKFETYFDQTAEVTTALYAHANIDINYDSYPDLTHIICPMTNILHLKAPEHVKVIYLDNPDELVAVKSSAEWVMWAMFNLLKRNNQDLTKKKIGLIGYGRLGQNLAKMLCGFDCPLFYYDIAPKMPSTFRAVSLPDMESVFNLSEIVVIACTAGEETRNLISDEQFGMMADGSYFINVSRGMVVNPKALIRAHPRLNIAIDVVDSYDGEDMTNILAAQSEGLIWTNHTAGKSIQSRITTDKIVLRKYSKLVYGD